MNACIVPHAILISAIAIGACFSPFHASRGYAAVSTHGTVEGRVINLSTGEHVTNARLTIEGTTIEAFSDPFGYFRLSPAPAGSVTVVAFYTGLQPGTASVAVAPGEIVKHDIQLAPSAAVRGRRGADPVVLPRYAVSASREIDAAALAINEQRFAPNIKTVVSLDEFGPVAEGNVAEFLKFLPGVNINYQAGNARGVSINGVPTDHVPITVNGINLASANTDSAATRSVVVDLVSATNNLSRIELIFSPTPESPGRALAGSVNLIPRSAFERSRPVLDTRAYVMLPDSAKDFRKTPGTRGKPSRNVHPGAEFNYTVPVNQRFGFTLTGAYSTRFDPFDSMTNTWRGGNAATNGTNFLHTTPGQTYLSTYSVGILPKITTRRSVGATLDYRLTRNDRLSFNFQYTSFEVWFMGNYVAFNVGRVLPGDFTSESTHGAAAAGNVVLTHEERNRFARSYMPTLTWRHDGPVWKLEAGVAHSQHSDYLRDTEKGSFRSVTAVRTGLTVSFDEISPLRPGRITVTDGRTGAPVDPHALSTYALNSGWSLPITISDLQRSAFANARRDFHGRVAVTVKTGIDVRDSVRDARGGERSYGLLGRDGRISTTPIGSDDSALPFMDALFSQSEFPFGFPRTEGVSNRALWGHYQANPSEITFNPDAVYRSAVSQSKHIEEIISSVYGRTDVALFNRRLRLVGGVRAEQTNIRAQGPLTDPTRNFRRDAQGAFVLGANGRPLTIATNALQFSQLTYIDRGARVEKEYLRLFPSLNASINLRENFMARAAVYSSIGRPNLNQYAGGVTLPNTQNPPGPTNRIDTNNAGIKPWTAESLKVRIEYYFSGVGQISVGAFRRHFRNFWEETVTRPSPEFLALYGLDDAIYADYDVVTERNIPGVVRMDGIDVDYKQALTFLPAWARGLQVFANGTTWRATGANLSRFPGAFNAPRSGNFGISLTRERYNVRANWNYRGRQRRGAIAAGPSIVPGSYTWQPKHVYLDVSGEYRLSRYLTLFANLRNLNAQPEDSEVVGPNLPRALYIQRYEYGSAWTFGVRGRF